MAVDKLAFVPASFILKKNDFDSILFSLRNYVGITNASPQFLMQQGGLAPRIPARAADRVVSAVETAAKDKVLEAQTAQHEVERRRDSTPEQVAAASKTLKDAFENYKVHKEFAEITFQQTSLKAQNDHLMYEKLCGEIQKILEPLRAQLFLNREGLGLGDGQLKLHELEKQIEAMANSVSQIRPTELYQAITSIITARTDPVMYNDFKDTTLAPLFHELSALLKRSERSGHTTILSVKAVKSIMLDLIPGGGHGEHACRDKCKAVALVGENPTLSHLDAWYGNILPIVADGQRECPDRPLKKVAYASSSPPKVAAKETTFKVFIGALDKFQMDACSSPCDLCGGAHAFGPSCEKAKVMWPQVYDTTASKYGKFASVMPSGIEHPKPPAPRTRESPKGKA